MYSWYEMRVEMFTLLTFPSEGLHTSKTEKFENWIMIKRRVKVGEINTMKAC